MKNESLGNFGKCCVDAGVSALISVGIAAVMLFLLGLVVYRTDDPGKLITATAVIISAVAFVSAGVIGAVKGNGFWIGCFSGLMLFCIFFLLSLFFDGNEGVVPYSKMPYSLVSYAVELLFSAAGAFFASTWQRKKYSAPRVPKIKHK